MSEISYSEKKHYEQIIDLYKICFPDTTNFTKWYFSNVFSFENTLIYAKNEEIIAMLQELPVTFSNSEKATYIYAACTKPEYRNQGIMKKLLNRSFENDIKKGINISVLIPENKDLFKFYKKFGYIPTTKIKKEIFSKTLENDTNYLLKKAEFDNINVLNALYIYSTQNSISVKRDLDFWKKQITMLNSLNGYCYCLFNKNTNYIDGYAIGWNESEKESLIQEICCINEYTKNILCKNILQIEQPKRLLLNTYDITGDYSACIKFHKPYYSNNKNKKDYILNILYN